MFQGAYWLTFWNAILAPVLVLQSMWSIIDVFAYPETSKPSLATDWYNMTYLEVIYLEWVSFVSDQAAPVTFFLTQIFTLGESNFSDFSIFFMNQEEAAWWFAWNATWITIWWPVAITWFIVWWWAYLLEWTIQWLLDNTCQASFMDPQYW
jgi:hypothetical protein